MNGGKPVKHILMESLKSDNQSKWFKWQHTVASQKKIRTSKWKRNILSVLSKNENSWQCEYRALYTCVCSHLRHSISYAYTGRMRKRKVWRIHEQKTYININVALRSILNGGYKLCIKYIKSWVILKMCILWIRTCNAIVPLETN